MLAIEVKLSKTVGDEDDRELTEQFEQSEL